MGSGGVVKTKSESTHCLTVPGPGGRVPPHSNGRWSHQYHWTTA